MSSDNTPQSDTSIRDALGHIDNRLDRMESKLDDHLERVTSVERDIVWVQGHLKIATAIFLSVVGFLGTALWKYIFPTK